MASRSIVDESLQCRSSRTRTRGEDTVRTSRGSTSSRSIRAARALCARPPPPPRQPLVGGECRQRREPRRRMLLENGNDLAAPRFPAQAPERLEYWQIGLASAVLFDPLSATHAQGSPRSDLREKGLDQRRLPDARLAGHEHELPPPVHRLVQQLS